MLNSAEIDALMSNAVPPRGFYQEASRFVRLFPDYRSVEREYYRRTGIYPALHLIALRRRKFEESPAILRIVFDAREASKRKWYASRRAMTDTTPWLAAELEDAERIMGFDWMPNRH